ncbi:MAG: NUDIX domain-containing protein, partial [Candidatus Omnitrophica bacterium]|nr:NUDIX domain-containing protein [Candidatus Omnitrophota bacterium]
YDGDLHRDVRVFIVNEDGEVFVQKRGDKKDIEPGVFAESCGGHLGLGDDYLEAAYRECAEELRLDKLGRERLFEVGIYYDEVRGKNHAFNRSLYMVYVYRISKDEESSISINREDGIAGGRFVPLSEVRKKVLANPDNFTASFARAFSDKSIYKLMAAGNLAAFNYNRSMPLRYRELAGSFYDDFECRVDFSKETGERVEKAGISSGTLAVILEEAVESLESIIGRSGDIYLEQHLRAILTRRDNRAPPVRVRVSSALPAEAARYYDGKTHQAEIILSLEFVLSLIDAYYLQSRKAAIMLAARLFHEAGHTAFVSFYQYLREEYELIKADARLYELLSDYGLSALADYPSDYLELIVFIVNNPDFIEDFDSLVSEVHKLESDAEEIYRRSNEIGPDGEYLYTVDANQQGKTYRLRSEHIDRSFERTDPSYFLDSPAKRVAANQFIRGSFLGIYREILFHRGIAQGRESFLFLAREPLTIIPFNQLKAPRVPPDTKGKLVDTTTGAGREKEARRWARQYYALHKGRRFSDGIGVTEAENGRGMQQKWHKHDASQEFTTSLCDNTQIRWARRLGADEETVIVTREGRDIEVIKEGEDEGKEVIEVSTPEGDIKIVVAGEEYVPFGHMIAMSRNTFHTLRNTSAAKPSIDFTVKEPVTQVIKSFSPPQEVPLDEPQILNPEIEDFPWGKIYRHYYLNPYNRRLSIDPLTGEMIYTVDDQGCFVPVMYDLAKLRLSIVEVYPGHTATLPFSPLYEDQKFQVVRVLPWPRSIPEDNAQIPERNWLLDRDHSKIKAKVKVHSQDGSLVCQDIAEGGDIVLLDNSEEESISYYTLTNNSSENYSLVFFIVEVVEVLGSNQACPVISNDNGDVLMGFGGSLNSVPEDDRRDPEEKEEKKSPFKFSGCLVKIAIIAAILAFIPTIFPNVAFGGHYTWEDIFAAIKRDTWTLKASILPLALLLPLKWFHGRVTKDADPEDMAAPPDSKTGDMILIVIGLSFALFFSVIVFGLLFKTGLIIDFAVAEHLNLVVIALMFPILVKELFYIGDIVAVLKNRISESLGIDDSNNYPLAIPQDYRERARHSFGPNRIITDVRVNNLTLPSQS